MQVMHRYDHDGSGQLEEEEMDEIKAWVEQERYAQEEQGAVTRTDTYIQRETHTPAQGAVTNTHTHQRAYARGGSMMRRFAVTHTHTCTDTHIQRDTHTNTHGAVTHTHTQTHTQTNAQEEQGAVTHTYAHSHVQTHTHTHTRGTRCCHRNKHIQTHEHMRKRNKVINACELIFSCNRIMCSERARERETGRQTDRQTEKERIQSSAHMLVSVHVYMYICI
jgi:hypothetical protein